MKNTILRGIGIALMITLFFPVNVLGLGVAMGPATMEVADALRGGEYERMITVFNPGDDEAAYQFRADGQAASWLVFYDWASKKPVQKLTIPGKNNVSLLLKINVPSDAANSNYTATVYAETIPVADLTQPGVSVIMQASAALTIRVSGTQIIDGNVVDITTLDTEAALPLRLNVVFKNLGNVAFQPQIRCIISTGTTTIDEFIYSNSTVKAELQGTIPVEWATTSAQVGDYVAKVTVSLPGGKIIATKEIPFKILPLGTLTRQGELISLAFEGQPVVDGMLKIQAGFKNTGQADDRAKLIAEVYLDNTLVDTTKSEEYLIPVGKSDSLVAYLKLTKAGRYVIKGWVSFDGKQTEKKDIEINITAGNVVQPVETSVPSTDSGPFGFTVVTTVVIGILVILIIYLFFRDRARRNT